MPEVPSEHGLPRLLWTWKYRDRFLPPLQSRLAGCRRVIDNRTRHRSASTSSVTSGHRDLKSPKFRVVFYCRLLLRERSVFRLFCEAKEDTYFPHDADRSSNGMSTNDQSKLDRTPPRRGFTPQPRVAAQPRTLGRKPTPCHTPKGFDKWERVVPIVVCILHCSTDQGDISK